MAQTQALKLWKMIGERSREVIDPASLKRKLRQRRNLRIKLGIDPTTPELHLGHLVPLKMLRSFQDAGHRAVLIIGDFTAQIGDPSGKMRARRQLAAEEIKLNERTYRAQIGKVLDLKRAEVRYNSEWHGRMKLKQFLELLKHFALKTACQRQDFQARLRSAKPVFLHEAMYSVLQAYDSVAVRADVEIGGLDQRLNLLAGRELQRSLNQPPQDVVLMPYLIGLDGRQKMSKSAGNTINLTDGAPDMFGKTMSIPDGLIADYARLAAWLEPHDVANLLRRLASGENPRDVKLDVAEAVVRAHHGRREAEGAREMFLAAFSRRELSQAAAAVRIAHRPYRALELLLRLGAARSRSEGRRLIKGRGLAVDGRIISDPGQEIKFSIGKIIRVGKRRLFRLS